MKPEGDLTPLQIRAIDALLTTDTREQAAAEIGVNVRTLRRWSNLGGFSAELQRRRTKVLDAAGTVLAAGSAPCGRALVAIATGTMKSDPARVAAARAVLEYAQVFEQNGVTAERLAKLERWALALQATTKAPWQ